ncbi:uncharacterized protein LOC123867218 isoform X2 [Maniola jurtina]|uniref:uncharacterized protein LOC123867218 isoform X2 n=1 Tax=Maniola jurtina TaxID=191418 RepID=UPI001E688528|nr:uncharacterized protein LOC123867218 isoform X2 [Maniola jurtina]
MEYDTSEILEDSEDSHKTKKNKNLYEAEDYLNLRVKQEQATFAEPTPMKTTKKKKHKEDLKQNEDEIDVHEHNLDTSCLVNDDHSETSEIDISNRKTKKKKKEKLSMDYDTSEILEDSADSCQTKKKKNKELLQADDGNDELQHEENSQISNSKILSSTLIQENGSIQENDRKQYNSDASTLESNPRTSAHKSSEVSLKKACRISDRIQFEEDSVDYEPKEDSPKLDVQLQQFISSSVNLRQLQDSAGEPCISDDDEVWIFKVPHDISVGDLENKNLTLDGKKKVKINGNTYDTNIDTTVSATPILIFNKRKACIKNIPSKGVINLRKRIPKIHIPYESLTMSNENTFIPLPDTKCRHPLFGAHYKKAARVPPAVAERLHRASLPPRAAAAGAANQPTVETESDVDVKPNIEELHSHRKKRKMKEKLKKESDTDANPGTEALSSKKKKRKSEERLRFEADSETKPSMEVSHSKKRKKKNKRRLETESDMEMKLNTEALHSNKKKRKHSEERGARKKAKREKHDPSGADAWDSERAIEKNLFDF